MPLELLNIIDDTSSPLQQWHSSINVSTLSKTQVKVKARSFFVFFMVYTHSSHFANLFANTNSSSVHHTAAAECI